MKLLAFITEPAVIRKISTISTPGADNELLLARRPDPTKLVVDMPGSTSA